MSSSSSFTIANICIFTGHDFIENGHVAIQKGKIVQVSSGAAPSSTAGTQTLSTPGYTLMPGLIDAHVHTGNAKVASLEQSLDFGVTTVCELSNAPEYIEKMIPLARDPAKISKYADYKFAGSAATCDGGWPDAVVLAHNPAAKAILDQQPKVNRPEDAEPFIQKQINLGASFIKMHHETGESLHVKPNFMPLESRKAVVQAAKEHNLPIVAHSLSHRGTMDVLRDGVNGMAHMFMDVATSDDFVQLYKEKDAHCNPTLSLIGSITTEGKELQRRFVNDPLAKELMLEEGKSVEHMCQCLSMGNEDASVENAYAATRALYEAGVPLIVGSDTTAMAKGTAFGLTVHQEMWLFAHEVRMEPVDVLKAATSTTAKRFGFEDRGSIEVGKRADLLLLEGDVRQILRDRSKLCLPIVAVWRDGIVAERWKTSIDGLIKS